MKQSGMKTRTPLALALACGLIVMGALIAAKDIVFGRRPRPVAAESR